MKNLKIKFGIFNLLAILAVSVFLTSCEQDILPTEPTQEITQQGPSKSILLPQDIVNQGEDAVEAYMKTLSKEEVTQHINDYIIMEFLQEKGKLTQVDEEFQVSGNFSSVSLSNYLSDEEIAELNTQIVEVKDNQLSERWWLCYDVYYYYCCGYIYKYSHTECIWIT